MIGIKSNKKTSTESALPYGFLSLMPVKALILILGTLNMVACGGGSSTEALPQQSGGGSSTTSSDIYGLAGEPVERDDTVRAYKNTVFDGLRLTDRCGGCHTTTSSTRQSPFFVQRDDVNAAYDAAIANNLINTSTPSQSRLVTKVLSGSGPQGHNCWLEAKEACAAYITNRIQNMIASTSSGDGHTIVLTAPADHEIEVSFTLPDTPPAEFTTLHNLLRTNCATCHVPGAAIQGSPFFAVADADTAYNELRANDKIVMGETVESRARSRIVVRPRDESHGCWDTNNDGNVDCAESAQLILNAISAMVDPLIAAQQSQTQTVNNMLDNIRTSKALTMADAIPSNGGNRYEANQIALYEFKEGAGRDVVDVSNSAPGVNLRLFGTEGVDYRWLGGYGVEFMGNGGKASADPDTVDKLYNQIISTGEYSVEAWITPANVTQADSNIVSYMAGEENQNFSLKQDMYNYQFYNRTTQSTNQITGAPAAITPDADEVAQAALQHVVVTYNPIDGRKIYVNGRLTGTSDPLPGGGLAAVWNPGYTLVLGNADDFSKAWRGAVRLLAVHKSELTPEQIQQNFDVGVGETYYMLFPLRKRDTDQTDTNTSEPPLDGVPASCHIMFEFARFDGYSYLFHQPKFICLDPADDPTGIRVKGLWLGINGEFPNAGQAYQNIDVTIDSSYTPENGQVLSPIGTVIELQNGPLGSNADQFFLGFEIIAAETPSTFIPDPAASLPPPAPLPDPAPSSDIGVRTFDEINATMSLLTGIPETNTTVVATYNQYKQQLPTVEAVDGFLPSHQMAVAQLALTYCDQLVEADESNTTNLGTYFLTGFNYAAPVSTALDTAGRQAVVNKFMQEFMNYDTSVTPALTLSTQPSTSDVMNYLTATGSVTLSDDNGSYGTFTSLMQQMSTTSTTKQIVKATCGAVLGSAVMLLQ